MCLIAWAKNLNAKEPMSIELDAMVCALDATTIDLCLSLFGWALFRMIKAAVHTSSLLTMRLFSALGHMRERQEHANDHEQILLVIS